MPAALASVSGAKPVQPEIPIPTLTSSAKAVVEARSAAVTASSPYLRIVIVLCCWGESVEPRAACDGCKSVQAPRRASLQNRLQFSCSGLACIGSSFAAPESCDETVLLAGIDQSHRRERLRLAP